MSNFSEVTGGTNPDFTPTDIGTLTRTQAHSIRISMDFVAGASNDVVQVYIDGVLKKTGTAGRTTTGLIRTRLRPETRWRP